MFRPLEDRFAKDSWSHGAVLLISFKLLIGQHNDSRMNLSIALTAIRNEACMANHTEVLSLLKENGKVVGATVQDRETGLIFFLVTNEFYCICRGIYASLFGEFD